MSDVCLFCLSVLLSARCSCVQALQRVPLFAGLDPKTKGAIASALGQVSMPKGTAVVTQVGGGVRVLGLRPPQQGCTTHVRTAAQQSSPMLSDVAAVGADQHPQV